MRRIVARRSRCLNAKKSNNTDNEQARKYAAPEFDGDETLRLEHAAATSLVAVHLDLEIFFVSPHEIIHKRRTTKRNSNAHEAAWKTSETRAGKRNERWENGTVTPSDLFGVDGGIEHGPRASAQLAVRRYVHKDLSISDDDDERT